MTVVTFALSVVIMIILKCLIIDHFENKVWDVLTCANRSHEYKISKIKEITRVQTFLVTVCVATIVVLLIIFFKNKVVF